MLPRPVLPAALALVAVLTGCGLAGGTAAPAPDDVAGGTAAAGTTGAPAPSGARRGAPAPSQLRTEVPESLVLPGGIRMAVRPVRTDAAGRLAVPTDVHVAGWWSGGARLADPFGSMVLVGHVDAATQGIGDMASLLRARAGDTVQVAGAGLSRTYRVTGTRQLAKGDLSDAVVEGARLFDQRTSARLVLVTCSGPFDPVRRHYRDNFVVVATPLA